MSLFLRRIANRLRPVSLEGAAVSRRVLCPGMDYPARPSFHLPGEFEAVQGVVNGDMALEWKRVSGATRHHLATVEYVLERARLKDDYLCAGRYVIHYRTSRPLREKAPPVRLDAALLSTNILSGLEFGHWVRDSLVTEIYGAEQGLPAVALGREPWPHEPDFRALGELQCLYPSDCTVGRLTILDDRGHTHHWRDRFLALRGRTRAGIAALAGESAGPLVFLSRGANARMREPSNLDAIEAALGGLGFRTIVPSAMSVQEVGLALRDAKLVVSAEGSNLNHLHFFAPDGVALVSLQDPHRFYAYHKGPMDFYDGHFGFIVGRPDPDAPGRHKVSIDDLKRTIDLA